MACIINCGRSVEFSISNTKLARIIWGNIVSSTRDICAAISISSCNLFLLVRRVRSVSISITVYTFRLSFLYLAAILFRVSPGCLPRHRFSVTFLSPVSRSFAFCPRYLPIPVVTATLSRFLLIRNSSRRPSSLSFFHPFYLFRCCKRCFIISNFLSCISYGHCFFYTSFSFYIPFLTHIIF